MFAWIYKKSDLWVVGTGYDQDVRVHQDRFLAYVKQRYHLEGEIVKKEGFSSSIDFSNPDRIWLGEDRILMTGDAAGLIDPTRGVGMDSAAISGRLAAKAIVTAEDSPKSVLSHYTQYMKKTCDHTRKNQHRGINQFTDNVDLLRYLKKNMLKMGFSMVVQNFLNRFRSGEQQTLLP